MILAGATAYPFFCFVDMNGENSRQITFLYSWQRSCARKYRISEEDLQVMLTAQNRRCAIRDEPFTETPAVDRCHAMGRARGLLCSPRW
jgi:hypothetical protein